MLRGAERQRWQIAKIHEDVSSGVKSVRTALNRPIADARARKFDCLLVWKLDRGLKYDMNRYLPWGDHVPLKNLTEIVKSGLYHPNNQRRLENADKAAENGPDSKACQADMAYREQVRAAVVKTMDKLKLDAFVYPTWSNPPRLIGDLNTPAGDNSQFYSPTTSFPAINIPMGYTCGRTQPAGMTIYSRPWSEAKLIKLAYAYEQATRHRRSPATPPPFKVGQASGLSPELGLLWALVAAVGAMFQRVQASVSF